MWGTLFKALHEWPPGEGDAEVEGLEVVDALSMDTGIQEGGGAEGAADGVPSASPGPLRDTGIALITYLSPQDDVLLKYPSPRDFQGICHLWNSS